MKLRRRTPVAKELASRGYQSFVVNCRLRPYTQEKGALDLARAVRFVRKNADVYGIDEDDIAVMGFSAGGILAGEMRWKLPGRGWNGWNWRDALVVSAIGKTGLTLMMIS